MAGLDDRCALLAAGSRAALPGQQMLQALVDWRCELRSRAERVTWARLAIFAHWDNEKCSSEARTEYEPGRLTRKTAPGRT